MVQPQYVYKVSLAMMHVTFLSAARKLHAANSVCMYERTELAFGFGHGPRPPGPL